MEVLARVARSAGAFRMSRIALIYPSNLLCAWACSQGLEQTVERMGHQIVPPGDPADLSIVSGPEHVEVDASKLTGVKVALPHESAIRPDRNFSQPFRAFCNTY